MLAPWFRGRATEDDTRLDEPTDPPNPETVDAPERPDTVIAPVRPGFGHPTF